MRRGDVVCSNGLVSLSFLGCGGDAVPERVLLDELHASVSLSRALFLAVLLVMIRLVRL